VSGPSDLYDLCSDYLAACEQAVATTDGGAIARSFVSPGPAAIDCPDQLAVWSGGPLEADTAPLSPPLQLGRRASPGESGHAVHLVNLTCLVTRCAPTVKSGGEMPNPAELEAAGKQHLQDVWAIWNVVRALYRAGAVFTRDDGIQRELFFDGAIPLLPQGTAMGWQVPIRVQIDGYHPTVAP
jgi:hypothetical protein